MSSLGLTREIPVPRIGKAIPGSRAAPRVWLVLLLLMATATPLAAEESAEAALLALEHRLIEAEEVSFRFDIRAAGSVPAALVGDLQVGPGDAARIEAAGSFAGQETAIRLDADQEIMTGSSGEKTFSVETPQALREGLLIGFTRMGLLHNLAVLSGGAPPDRTDGSVSDWVRYSAITLGPEETVGGSQARRFSFTVVVDGVPSAVAELWVDATTGLPLRRVQVVRFAEGDMRVLEQYQDFSIEPGD